MLTRSKTGKSKPKAYMVHTESEPTSTKQTLNKPEWAMAMRNESNALQANITWTLITLPRDRKVVGCMRVFKIKENAHETIQKHKVGLVAKGFHQEHGCDYTETLSPMVNPTTIRVILTLAITYKMGHPQIDVNNAFLNGNLHDDAYMKQPSGFVSTDKTLVCKLNKAIYGLKQALGAWYEKLHQVMVHYF